MERISRRLSLVLAAAAMAAGVLLTTVASAEVKSGDRAAEFVNVKDARGKRIKLRGYRGKVVVVTFGASWCKPCKKELAAWEKLAREYKKQDVVFLAVNIDTDLAKGKAFIKRAGLVAMRAGFEPGGGTVATYEPPTMPTTYVVGQRGLVRFRHQGYRAGDEKALATHIDKLLAR